MGQSPSTPAMVRPGKRRSFRANWKHRRSQTSQGNLSATCNFLDTDLKVDQLNINLASEEELMTLPGVTRTVAQNIVEYRRVIGRFNKVEDLALVPGIGANKLDLIRPEICVNRKKNLSRSSSHAQSIDSLPSQDSLSIPRSICKGSSFSRAINLNTASVFDLMTINTLNQELAANIVEYRQRRGHYQSVDDLAKVKGINSYRLSAIRPHLYIDESKEESKSLPLNGSGINSITTIQSPPLTNGRMPGHRKSLSAPIKYIPVNNGISSPVKDIFELLSAYSPRPIVEEDFTYVHNGRTAARIASWCLQDFSCEKASNPGVLETICRTILENKFSLIAVQGIEDPVALSKICRELNSPTLRRVSDWKDNSREWLYWIDDKSSLGFLYDSKRTHTVRLENFDLGCVDALLASFQLNSCQLEIVNIDLKGDGFSTLTQLLELNTKSNRIITGDITPLIRGQGDSFDFQEASFIIPKTTCTNTGSGQQKNRLYDNIIITSSLQDRYTGVHGVVRQGLSHLAIPRGWTWGGFISDHCPVWCEFYTD